MGMGFALKEKSTVNQPLSSLAEVNVRELIWARLISQGYSRELRQRLTETQTPCQYEAQHKRRHVYRMWGSFAGYCQERKHYCTSSSQEQTEFMIMMIIAAVWYLRKLKTKPCDMSRFWWEQNIFKTDFIYSTVVLRKSESFSPFIYEVALFFSWI